MKLYILLSYFQKGHWQLWCSAVFHAISEVSSISMQWLVGGQVVSAQTELIHSTPKSKPKDGVKLQNWRDYLIIFSWVYWSTIIWHFGIVMIPCSGSWSFYHVIFGFHNSVASHAVRTTRTGANYLYLHIYIRLASSHWVDGGTVILLIAVQWIYSVRYVSTVNWVDRRSGPGGWA